MTSIFDTLKDGSARPTKEAFVWQRDAHGTIVLPSLPPLATHVLDDPDEVSVTYTSTDSSVNDDGSVHVESVEVKAVKRRNTDPQARPKWEEAARDKLKRQVDKISGPLRDLLERDGNEGDTRMFVNEILVGGLGYDRYTEISTEFMIRGEFCDYVIKLDNDVKVIIEVKRVGKRLVDRDIKQAEAYALRQGVEWTVLTNGVSWRLYHVTASVPTKLDLIFDVSLLDDPETAVEKMYYLTRASLGRDQVAALWKYVDATNPDAIRELLLSIAVVDEVRRGLGRVSGVRLESDEVARLINDALH
jgi:hypothetical protein